MQSLLLFISLSLSFTFLSLISISVSLSLFFSYILFSIYISPFTSNTWQTISLLYTQKRFNPLFSNSLQSFDFLSLSLTRTINPSFYLFSTSPQIPTLNLFLCLSLYIYIYLSPVPLTLASPFHSYTHKHALTPFFLELSDFHYLPLFHIHTIFIPLFYLLIYPLFYISLYLYIYTPPFT